MKVIAFDSYDVKREKPVQIEVKKVKKDEVFTMNGVTYQITKVFKRKSIEVRCIEIKMVAYKLENTVTTFSHKCPAKKGLMQRMKPETKELMVKKYGKHTIDAWEEGKNKMKIGSLTSVCPDCGVVFFKDKVELPEKVEVLSTYNKKQLIKRT